MAVTNRHRTRLTYRVVFSHNGPTGDALELIGSDAKTVTLTQLAFQKPSAAITLALIKRGTADTGTATARTPIPVDSQSIAGSATVKAYTAAPGTAGAVQGTVAIWPVATTDLITYDANRPQVQSVTLHGTTETLALNLSGTAAITGWLEWTEE